MHAVLARTQIEEGRGWESQWVIHKYIYIMSTLARDNEFLRTCRV